MLVRYANKDGKLRKVYVIRTTRQATLFDDGVKFVATVSTSLKGTNPWEVPTANLLKEKPAPVRRPRYRGAN